MSRSAAVLALAVASLTFAGCEKKPPASPTDPAVAAEAKQVWETRCISCHGDRGRGDGPGAAALDPKPRSFADKMWQNRTKDDRIKKVIVEGGKAVGLSEGMTPNPDLKDKPAVVNELVKLVRSFG